MFSKLTLVLTIITYLALIAVNLYRPKGTGDQLVGWGFIVFGVLAAYVLCSIILTIHIAVNGKFDWISDSNTLRNILILIGMACLLTGAVYTTMINMDRGNSDSINWFGLILLRYGAIWIPLLMLVPYSILLNPEWQNTVSPYLYKVSLLAGCLIGFCFIALSNKQMSNLFSDNKAISQSKYNEEMRLIGFDNSVTGLLVYMYKGTDARLTQAALTKLKGNKNLESELVNILNSSDENSDYFRVIAYLENNKVENPALFVIPLNKAISKIGEELRYRLQSFGSENDFLELLNVDGLCRILDTQFEAYKKDFRPNMLNLQAQLEKEPKPDFLEIRNKYKMAVKNWLDQIE